MSRLNTLFIHAGVGVASGIVCGVFSLSGEAGVFAPGVVFGLATVFASHLAKQSLRHPFLVAVGIFVAWIGTVCCMLVSGRLPWNTGPLLAINGLLGGFTGSLLISFALLQEIKTHKLGYSIGIVSLGAGLAAALFPVSIVISDSKSWGHPYDDFFLYVIWQAGMLTLMGLAISPPHISRARDCSRHPSSSTSIG